MYSLKIGNILQYLSTQVLGAHIENSWKLAYNSQNLYYVLYLFWRLISALLGEALTTDFWIRLRCKIRRMSVLIKSKIQKIPNSRPVTETTTLVHTVPARWNQHTDRRDKLKLHRPISLQNKLHQIFFCVITCIYLLPVDVYDNGGLFAQMREILGFRG